MVGGGDEGLDPRVDDFFLTQVKLGLRPNVKELQKFCTENDIIASRKQLNQVRYHFEASATFSRWTSVRPHFVAPLIPRPGNIFVDLAFFKPNLAAFNDMNKYILVGVDELTGVITAYPMPNKLQETWHAKLLEMIFTDFYVTPRYFITDRDSSISNPSFQKHIKEDFGVGWCHLPIRSKSYLAERGMSLGG